MKQLPLPVQLATNTTFENYIEGRNAPLVHFLRNLQRDEHEVQCLVWSKPASGKTHLLQALCHQAVINNSKLGYIPLKELYSLGPELLYGLDQLELVCIDDIDTIVTDDLWCNKLFQLINRCRELSTVLVMSSQAHPGELDIALPDLKSRLLWGPVFHIKKLSDEQLLSVIVERANEKGLALSNHVAHYLLKHCSRDVSELTTVINKLDDESLVQKRRITLPLVKQVLQGREG